MEMEFQKILILCALLALPAHALDFPARHEHWRKGCDGTLSFDERGVSFHGAKQHSFTWTYRDIQQLRIAPTRVRILTYKDNPWKLGAESEYTFTAHSGRPFVEAYQLLKNQLDQRLVADLPDQDVKPLWEIPVKHLERFRGTQGVLVIGEDRIVYRCDKADDARTWRFEDIDSVSSSGPFQLTLTTFERAMSHYGSLKAFNFQLKQPLDEANYNALWRRLNSKKGTIHYD
jgi:hypothetical protein